MFDKIIKWLGRATTPVAVYGLAALVAVIAALVAFSQSRRLVNSIESQTTQIAAEVNKIQERVDATDGLVEEINERVSALPEVTMEVQRLADVVGSSVQTQQQLSDSLRDALGELAKLRIDLQHTAEQSTQLNGNVQAYERQLANAQQEARATRDTLRTALVTLDSLRRIASFDVFLIVPDKPNHFVFSDVEFSLRSRDIDCDDRQPGGVIKELEVTGNDVRTEAQRDLTLADSLTVETGQTGRFVMQFRQCIDAGGRDIAALKVWPARVTGG